MFVPDSETRIEILCTVVRYRVQVFPVDCNRKEDWRMINSVGIVAAGIGRPFHKATRKIRLCTFLIWRPTIAVFASVYVLDVSINGESTHSYSSQVGPVSLLDFPVVIWVCGKISQSFVMSLFIIYAYKNSYYKRHHCFVYHIKTLTLDNSESFKKKMVP